MSGNHDKQRERSTKVRVKWPFKTSISSLHYRDIHEQTGGSCVLIRNMLPDIWHKPGLGAQNAITLDCLG